MKKFYQLCLMGLMVIGLVTGCGQAPTVQSIDNSSYFAKAQAKSEVAKAIKRGASSKGWRTKAVKNGLIEANILVRNKYFVAVNIPYTSKGYKIVYKSSRNLKYDPATKTIHGSYNKWTKILADKINYELENIGMSSATGTTTTMKASPVAAKTVTSKPASTYKKGSKIDLNGKTIYIKAMVQFSPNSRVKANIKQECTLQDAVASDIVKSAASQGLNIVVKNSIKPNELELKVQIENAVSAGNAAIGHSKYVVISGAIVKGKTKYYSFDAARLSGGGYFGAYRSSCSVLGGISRRLGKDVAGWLQNPYDRAELGDVQLIR